MSQHFNHSPIVQGGAGNFIQFVGVESGEGKPLAQCSVAELQQECRHRQRLLDEELSRMRWLLIRLQFWALTGGGATHLSSQWLGWPHGLTLALAALGVGLPLALLYGISQRGESAFAQRQRATLREIHFLLREKPSH
ncbi:hypothetical protein ACG04R_01290 [Roseateles sp. BYS78W]|uniref:DUF202 domain-containing protein n=1 Tax=Pelomonas candidula TaxID=3299025 RepID=A0ABW7H5V5_9BURK